MLLLVSGATRTVRQLMVQHPNLGMLLTPNTGNVCPEPGVIWAADNACFNGFDEVRFRAFLKKLHGRTDCLWVTAPDVVADSVETARLWREWRPAIAGAGLRPALVIQDGLTVEDVPWDEVGAIFVGGSTRYKLSETAAQIVGEGNRRNVWTHMGRVNTAKRLLFASAIGCRSIDGSSFSRFSKTHLPWALRLAKQRPLGSLLESA